MVIAASYGIDTGNYVVIGAEAIVTKNVLNSVTVKGVPGA
jgi:hypothetical protein